MTPPPQRQVPPRAEGFLVPAGIDASQVGDDYTLTILEQCSLFPRKLIFLLRGSFNSTYLLGKERTLPPIDTYFIINCHKTSTKPGL